MDLFGRASISDGNPTPVRHFLSLGIGGYSPLCQERGDTFGIGWYYVGASSQFGPLPQALFGPRNGTGVEAFYNFQVTPWLNVSPDVQYIQAGSPSDCRRRICLWRAGQYETLAGLTAAY